MVYPSDKYFAADKYILVTKEEIEMELLYAWINSDNTGYIQQEGFNFSPEYRFKMDYIDNKWKLSEDPLYHKKKSLFKNSVIENVTAVIGENGVGKTTLLKWLARIDCMPFGDKSDLEEQEKLYEEATHLSVLILKEDEKCIIYHDFEENKFENVTSIVNVVNTIDEDICGKIIIDASDFYNITKIFLTNSLFSPDIQGISKVVKIDTINFSPSALSVISSEFYEGYIKKSNIIPDYLTNKYLLTNWNLILFGSKTVNNFQEICDVLYFNKLFKSKKIDKYRGKICVDIEIWADSVLQLLEKKYKDFRAGLPLNEEDEKKKTYYKLYKGQQKLWLEITETYPYVIVTLLCNLIFEICLLTEDDIPRLKDIEQCKIWMDRIINEQVKERMETECRDFYNDLKEIEQLAQIVNSSEDKDNIYFHNNKVMKDSSVLSLERQPEKYKAFLQLVENSFNEENSYILRYIRIGNLRMSSGERAYQNLLSWINLVPQFHKIHKEMPEGLKHTVLLLIDEIDLYAHPDMQKEFINYFLDEIKSQFNNYKVQVVFTTHSPLCLSDIPVENTIYLTKQKEKCVVDWRVHSQTFGKDVFRILNDAFYLKNSTMGSFAKGKIDEIFRAIKDYQNKPEKTIPDNEYNDIKEKIDYIGNDLLRYKLHDMLSRCMNDRNEKIKILKSQYEAIGEEIRRLENS
ncbi:AAA family ATPase [Lachnospiraceae bacterium 62-35]